MKILKISLISIFIILLLSQNIFALGEVFSTADDWLNTGSKHTNTTMDTENLRDRAGEIYNIFLAVAVGVAVIVGAILGVQFMTAGIDKKVEVKQSLFPYIVSCVVVFGSMGIWKLVVTIISDI